MNPALLLVLCALVAAATPAPAFAAQPEPVGRLFFTPAQRASLDVARSQRARNTVATENPEEATPTAQTITYGGLVRRDDGRTTVWLNSQPVHDNDRSAAGAIVSGVRPDGRVVLQAPQGARRVELKPGQSVELTTGAIEEGYSRRSLSGPEPKPKPGAKPAPDARKGKPSPAETAKAVEEREERQQQVIEEAVSRAIVDTINARPAAPAAPAPAPSTPAR